MTTAIRMATRGRLIGVVAALALLASVVYATEAGADPDHKTFAVDLSPTTVTVGEPTTYTIEFSNTSPTQTLGSARVTVPSGFTAPAATGGYLTFDNLAIPAGGSDTRTFTATAACGSGLSWTWGVEGRQANMFNSDSGNEFTLDAATGLTTSVACSLGFSTQPADQAKDVAISDTAFSAGNPVAVTAYDQFGTTATWWAFPVTVALMGGDTGAALGGTATQTPVAGVATFADLTVDLDAGGYYLRASSSDDENETSEGPYPLATADSNLFDIVDAVTPCDAGQSCTASGNSSTTSATLDGTAGPTGSLAIISVNSHNELDGCGSAFGSSGSSDTVAFDLTFGVGTKTIVVTLSGATQPAAKYEMCFEGEAPFVDQDGNTVSVGILPDCKPKPMPGDLPCVSGRSQNPQAGTVTLTALLPEGDPLIKIG